MGKIRRRGEEEPSPEKEWGKVKERDYTAEKKRKDVSPLYSIERRPPPGENRKFVTSQKRTKKRQRRQKPHANGRRKERCTAFHGPLDSRNKNSSGQFHPAKRREKGESSLRGGRKKSREAADAHRRKKRGGGAQDFHSVRKGEATTSHKKKERGESLQIQGKKERGR